MRWHSSNIQRWWRWYSNMFVYWIKKCTVLYVGKAFLEIFWSPSVVFSPVQELPWELALPLRSSSSERTVTCPWEILRLGFPVGQENNGVCWNKLIMTVRHAPLFCWGKSNTHKHSTTKLCSPLFLLHFFTFRHAWCISEREENENKAHLCSKCYFSFTQ